jgi:putative selenium metabolism protein SsnA
MLLVGNGRVITRNAANSIIEDGCVAIKDQFIVEVGTTAELRSKYRDAKFMDAARKLIMPGLINTHMHFYSTFARGMASKSAAPNNFLEILERLWWKLDKTLSLDDVYYSALIPVIDCIKTGTTTIFDHHASPNAVHGSLFKIAEATLKAGVRSCLCYEVSDRDGQEIANDGIEENIDFINFCRQEQNPLLQGMFGLHASLTLSDKTLEKCVAKNSGSGAGFHVHTAEGIQDRNDSETKYGMGVVERLYQRQVLGEKSIAVHCVHITEKEIGILKKSSTNVVHNPESNMGNAVGVSPVLEMFNQGVTVGLGTDGYTSDLFESYKAANCLHKHAHQHPSVAWVEIPQMLFKNNAGIASQYFDKPLGQLVPGAYADLIVVDYYPPTRLTPENVNSHILFGVSGRAVETTVINGQVVMENRKLTTLDEEEICAKSRELADKVWERI